MARVSLELGSRGTVDYETLSALPIDDFIASLVTWPNAERSPVALQKRSCEAGSEAVTPRARWAPGAKP